MITRFMDVDMSMLAGETASVPSRVGDEERAPIGPLSGNLPHPGGKSSGVDRMYDPSYPEHRPNSRFTQHGITPAAR